MKMCDGKVEFIVEYCGDASVIRDFDFSKSISGIRDCIYESFRYINGRYPELVFNHTKVSDGIFEITVSCDNLSTDKMNLYNVVKTLGFLGEST